MSTILAAVGLIAAAVAAGLIVYKVIKLTVKALAALVRKLRSRGAQKVIVAELDTMIDNCRNRKSLSELEKLEEQGVTHVIAAVNEEDNLIDKVQMIQNEDDETAYEIVELLGDEGMVVIED